MKKVIILMLVFFCLIVSLSAKIDINRAELEELKTLPITEQQAEDIYNYRFYIKHFNSVYELREIDSIDQKTLNILKPLIIVSHYDDKDEIAERREEIYYLIERLGSNEGYQEGMSDVWEDYLTNPRNINKLTFSEILSLPNSSPLDAAAIRKRVAVGDSITDYRDLRKSPGISYYGASNIRHYVDYGDELYQKKLFIDYQFKYNDSSYEDDAREMYRETMIRYDQPSNDDPAAPREKNQSYWGYFNMEFHKASVSNKIRATYLNDWKAGFLYNSPKGESSLFEASADEIMKNGKYYIGYEKEFKLWGQNYLKAYLGNFRATFGEGLIMENSDYYSPRKTGYGFNKRITGIIGDLSRSQEYALRGLAIDWKRSDFSASLFYSSDEKDVVVYDSDGDGDIDNEDAVFSYITMTHRFSNKELKEAEEYFENYEGNINHIRIAPRKDYLQENMLGAHLEYTPFIGTHIGFTGYEMTYDKDFIVPQGDDLRNLLIPDDEYAAEKWEITDKEINALYSTKTLGYDRNYRRVYGFEWGTVWNNTSIQGEYAELEIDGSFAKIGDDPHAMIISAYTQFENLYLISIFRDYDLAFDNPYSRAFSESGRYDDTAFDNLAYALNNTLLSDIYINSSQPSSERGIYFETRYRFHEKLTLTKAYIDIWKRISDARNGIRLQATLEFRPIFQIRLRTRYKFQLKRYEDDLDRAKSQNEELQPELRFYLSNFDQIRLGYFYGQTKQPPYLSILSDPAEPDPSGDELGPGMAQASTLSTADAIYLDYTHNFNENLKIVGSFMIWRCQGGTIWDFEDVELDFDQSDRGFKYWFHIHSRLANNFFISFKIKQKRYLTREYEYRLFNEIPEDMVYYYDRVERKETSMRLQIDWKF